MPWLTETERFDLAHRIATDPALDPELRGQLQQLLEERDVLESEVLRLECETREGQW